MRLVLIEPHFLPCIEFFCALAPHQQVVMDRHAHYVKQGFRNRTVICTANGPLNLIVPVVHNTPLSQTPFGEVRIDPAVRWRTTMWRTIETAYRNAPFYDYFADDFRTILLARHEFLFDFNMIFIRHAFAVLRWNKILQETQTYEATTSGVDLRNQLSAKTSYTNRSFFSPFAYNQVFSGTFYANMSVLDLVFCCGPEAGRIIDKSALLEKVRNINPYDDFRYLSE